MAKRFVSVPKYADGNQISKQAVYQRVRRGTLESKVVNGKTLVALDAGSVSSKRRGQSQLVELRSKLEQANGTIESQREHIADLRTQVAEMRAKIDHGEILTAELRAHLGDLQRQLEQLNEENARKTDALLQAFTRRQIEPEKKRWTFPWTKR